MIDEWQGTLVMIAQPAEERGTDARAMLKDGLFERFPRPDYNLALHVSTSRPACQVVYTKGYAMANVDSVDITVYGVGGHGAYPHRTKTPVVLSAQIINAMQTLVSRELKPIDAGIVCTIISVMDKQNPQRNHSVVTCDPDILGGTPVFAGTRVPVRILSEHLEAGDRLDDFLDNFPSVTRIQATQAIKLAIDQFAGQGNEVTL